MQKSQTLAISKYTDGTYLITDHMACIAGATNTDERHDHVTLEQIKQIVDGRPVTILNYMPEVEAILA